MILVCETHIFGSDEKCFIFAVISNIIHNQWKSEVELSKIYFVYPSFARIKNF
jgi:hypothetical protein